MRSQNFDSSWCRKGTWLDEVLLDQLLTRFVYYSASGEKERIAFKGEKQKRWVNGYSLRSLMIYKRMFGRFHVSFAVQNCTVAAYWVVTAYEKIRTCQFQTSTLIPIRPVNLLDLTLATSWHCTLPYLIFIIYLGMCLKIRQILINCFLDNSCQLTCII